MKFLEHTICLVIFILGIIGLYVSYALIKAEYEQYVAEGKCVAKHIANGIERRDIKTRDGVCYVEGEL